MRYLMLMQTRTYYGTVGIILNTEPKEQRTNSKNALTGQGGGYEMETLRKRRGAIFSSFY